METITLILTALAAGASAGTLDTLKDDAKEKVKAAHERLHRLVKKRISGRPHGELALSEYESDPKKWEGLLTAELTEAAATQDDDLIAAARALLELIDRSDVKSGKYNVTIKDSSGVQLGDGNFQVNNF